MIALSNFVEMEDVKDQRMQSFVRQTVQHQVAEMEYAIFESILEPVQLIVLAHVVILFVMQMKQ